MVILGRPQALTRGQVLTIAENPRQNSGCFGRVLDSSGVRRIARDCPPNDRIPDMRRRDACEAFDCLSDV